VLLATQVEALAERLLDFAHWGGFGRVIEAVEGALGVVGGGRWLCLRQGADVRGNGRATSLKLLVLLGLRPFLTLSGYLSNISV
jgi:hypothetical protein